MGIVLVILILVGLVLLVLLSWCIAGRQSTWYNATSCVCGYDVESLVGSTIDSALLDGGKRCPECGRALDRGSVLVKGQTQTKYPPKFVALGVVGSLWLLIALIACVVLVIFAMPERNIQTRASTWHTLTDGTVRIDWTVRQTWQDRFGVVMNEVDATIHLDGGPTVHMHLAAQDYGGGYPGWRQGLFRDAEGVEKVIGLRDVPRRLEAWVRESCGFRNFANAEALVTVLRESMYGFRYASLPASHAEARPMVVTSQRSHVRHHWSYIAVCVGAAVLWLLGTWTSLRFIVKRPVLRVTYDAA